MEAYFLFYDPETKKVGYAADPRIRPTYQIFKAYGYRHWISTRPCNDVYDVVATKDYYIANDRDLYAGVKQIVVYNRRTGERINEIDIGCDCSFDITDDGSKIIYYNANTGYVEEATIPDLTVTQLFDPGWGSVNAIVKYIPGENNIMIAQKGGTSVEIRSRDGTLVDSLTGFTSVQSAAIEPENWIVVDGMETDKSTIRIFRRSDKTEIGRLPNLPATLINIHVRVPFTTYGHDKIGCFVTEYGGVPFAVYPIASNSLYPILEYNVFVGTYYFSIFEIPYEMPTIPRFSNMLYKYEFTLASGSEWDISFLRGTKVLIYSDQIVQVSVRAPIPESPYGYARYYTSVTPNYIPISSSSGTIFSISIDFGVWGNIKIKNTSSSDANIKIVAGV